jgi:hypothetical protein
MLPAQSACNISTLNENCTSGMLPKIGFSYSLEHAYELAEES